MFRVLCLPACEGHCNARIIVSACTASCLICRPADRPLPTSGCCADIQIPSVWRKACPESHQFVFSMLRSATDVSNCQPTTSPGLSQMQCILVDLRSNQLDYSPPDHPNWRLHLWAGHKNDFGSPALSRSMSLIGCQQRVLLASFLSDQPSVCRSTGSAVDLQLCLAFWLM